MIYREDLTVELERQLGKSSEQPTAQYEVTQDAAGRLGLLVDGNLTHEHLATILAVLDKAKRTSALLRWWRS
jgi:hypothetical protein